jgi:rfaE bifunctional protein kinase chain/domain
MIGVFGDIMLDKYIYCSSVRYSPECATAPVGVVTDTIYSLGGAANVAFNILKLGEETKLYGACSDLTTLDLIYGNRIPAKLERTRAKIIKNRYYINGKYYVRVDEESTIQYNPEHILEEIVLDAPKPLIISDYGKGTVTDFSRFKQKGFYTIVDAKKDFNLYRGAYIIKPNISEFYSELGILQRESLEDSVNYILNTDIAENFVDELDIGYMVITAGPLGAIIATNENTELIPTMNVNVVDVTGAGDSFIAALAVAISKEKRIREAVEFANKVASISVTKKGTGYVNYYET